MSKNDQTRLTQTVTFIRTQRSDFEFDQGVIADALDQWKSSNGAAALTLSGKMSQNGATNRPKRKTLRAYKRAMIMLKCAIGLPTTQGQWDGAVTEVNNMLDRNLAAMYAAELRTANDLLGSSAGRVNPLIDELRANPLRFLSNNKITISGKPTSNVFSYGFYMRDGKYKIDPWDWVDSHQKIRAINVPATLYATVKDSLGAIPGTSSRDMDDAALMFTTQFTGCTFCFSVNGASLVAAHIDPGGGIGRESEFDGVTISKALREGGGFSNGNGGDFKAYGRIKDGDYGYPETADQMTIVGVRSVNEWEVFSQILKDDKIESAEKIS